jgi:hypothetical protein
LYFLFPMGNDWLRVANKVFCRLVLTFTIYLHVIPIIFKNCMSSQSSNIIMNNNNIQVKK